MNDRRAEPMSDQARLVWALGEPSRRMLALAVCMNAVSALAGIVFWVA